MVNFSTGVSAVRSNQTALSVVGHNIANASTPGFHRRDVLFSENAAVNINGLLIGQGVSVDVIRRVQNQAAEDGLLTALSDGAGTELRLETAQQLEAMLTPGNGSLLDRFETFFNELERLSAFPDDSALRTTVVRSAEALTSEIQRVSSRLTQYASSLDDQVAATLGEVTDRANGVAKLNAEIAKLELSGRDAHDLRDRRDQEVRELAKLVDVQLETKPDGNFNIIIGGAIPIGTTDVELFATRNEAGEIEIRHPLCESGLEIVGGKLGGLIGAGNDSVGQYQKRLEGLVEGLVGLFDTAHAFGKGIRSEITQLTNVRDIPDFDAPLAELDMALPISQGELFVNVTDAAGITRTHRIEIDPQSDSVRDVGALLSSIDGIEAIIPTSGESFGIVAAAGHTFDFTGNTPEQPFNLEMDGSATVRIEGRHTDPTNDQLEFRFLNNGTIGVTEQLRLEVTDSDGGLIALLDVGEGYDPGSTLLVVPGINIRIDNGTAVFGDSFSANIVGQPDTTGFLAATGLNTFFTGNDANSIAVNPALLENPALLATTTTGNPSDTTNIQRMVALRDERIFGDGTQTIEQYLTDIVAAVGLDVNDLQQIASNNADLQDLLQSQIDAASGVDINEEVARMLQYQRSLQAAAQYISTLDDSLAELIAILR